MLTKTSAYVDRLNSALQSIDWQVVEDIAAIIRQRLKVYNRSLFVYGNGGSEANASHMVLHLREVGLRVYNLSDQMPWLTAVSNDVNYKDYGSRTLACLVGHDDAVVVISGSGMSPNILNALRWLAANRPGVARLGLLGFGGGDAQSLCDMALVLPQRDYGPVEDVHSVVIHVLKEMLQ